MRETILKLAKAAFALSILMLVSSQTLLPAVQTTAILQSVQSMRIVDIVPTESVPGEVVLVMLAILPLMFWGWLRFRFWLRRHVR